MGVRTRAERRKATVFELRPLFRRDKGESPLTEAQMEMAPAHFIEGEIENMRFVSVPPTTSGHSVDRLREMLQVAYSDKKLIMVLTHNIEILALFKLDRAAAAQVIRRIDDPIESEEFGKQQDIFRRVVSIVESKRLDLEKRRSGEKPPCMENPNEMSEWAMDFLEALRRIVDGDG